MINDENARPTRIDELQPREPELREALSNFKSSVTAWSDAMMSRPRTLPEPSRVNWQLMTKWALGCAVFLGTVSGGLYQNHRQDEAAKAAAVAAAQAAEQQRILAVQIAQETSPDDLMAKVDSDVAQEVPSALEPLASLMTDDENKGN